MQLADIDVGRVVAGKYELVRLIGKGAMGEVWLATHNTLGGEFAIKLVKPSDDEEDETAAGRFQLEAQVSAKLSRKTRHIVSVSDHGEEDGLAYLVMELLEGESLESRIKRVGELTLAETVAIVMQVARALGQAHAEQIFHRDLKPANVFLTKDEDGRLLVKLLDFGIARTTKPFRTRSPFMTGKDMVLGTPSYMSPEQARGLDTLDFRCDLWALAVVAYESLTRCIPWDGETVEDIFLSICTHRMIPILTRRSDLPPALEGLFAKSFAPKLDDRFKDAGELSEAFELLVDPMAVEAAMGPAVRAPGSSQRNLLAARALATPQEMPMLRSPGPTSESGVAVGGPTVFTRRKKSSGWLVGLIAALATIGIVVLAVTAFSRRSTASNNAPAETLPSTPAPPAPPIPPSVQQPSTPPPEAVTAPAIPQPPVVKATAQRPVSTRAAAPSRPAPALAASTAATTAAPVVAPPPHVPPSPPPTHVVTPSPKPTATVPDKGGVF